MNSYQPNDKSKFALTIAPPNLRHARFNCATASRVAQLLKRRA